MTARCGIYVSPQLTCSLPLCLAISRNLVIVFFLGEEEARMPNSLSLRARLEDLYLSNSYKKIAELF